MTYPRNIAHDKKVQQKKKYRGEEIAPGAEHAVRPGKKPHLETTDKPDTDTEVSDKDEKATGKPPKPARQQKSRLHFAAGFFVGWAVCVALRRKRQANPS